MLPLHDIQALKFDLLAVTMLQLLNFVNFFYCLNDRSFLQKNKLLFKFHL